MLYLQENNFLVHDRSFSDLNEVVIFNSVFKEFFIRKANLWTIEGKFRYTPSVFYRLLTVKTYIFGKSFSALYILLRNKTEYC
jgi:hypothetical protein